MIYRRKPGQPDIPLGDFLGDMTDELEDGSYITEFVSGGPKNYGYTTSTGKVCCKVRGFTLNVGGCQQLNYQVMRQNVLSEILNLLEQHRCGEPLLLHASSCHQTSQSGTSCQAMRSGVRQTSSGC